MPSKLRVIPFRPKPDLYAKIEQEAVRRGCSLSQVVEGRLREPPDVAVSSGPLNTIKFRVENPGNMRTLQIIAAWPHNNCSIDQLSRKIVEWFAESERAKMRSEQWLDRGHFMVDRSLTARTFDLSGRMI